MGMKQSNQLYCAALAARGAEALHQLLVAHDGCDKEEPEHLLSAGVKGAGEGARADVGAAIEGALWLPLLLTVQLHQ